MAETKSVLKMAARMSNTWETGAGGWGRFLSIGWHYLGSDWIDVGCGNGAFTELIVERCAPNEVRGVDPSKPDSILRATDSARLHENWIKGMRWRFRFPADTFDVAIMALVIFFCARPREPGVAEMTTGGASGRRGRGLRSGHIRAGGFTLEPLRIELRGDGT